MTSVAASITFAMFELSNWHIDTCLLEEWTLFLLIFELHSINQQATNLFVAQLTDICSSVFQCKEEAFRHAVSVLLRETSAGQRGLYLRMLSSIFYLLL